MAIVDVVEKGNLVYVYDKNKDVLFTFVINREIGDSVVEFSSDYISVKRGDMIRLYDKNGEFVSSKSLL